MSHWNHRVVRKTYPDGTAMLGIHEAFCDGAGLVWGITEDPVSPLVAESDNETVDDLKRAIGWMLKACDAPILDSENIPEPGAQGPDFDFDEEDLLPMDDLLDDRENEGKQS